MDRAAIFTQLTKRNALRKAAKLPLLDLRTEIAFAVEREAHRVYAEQCKRFDNDRRRIAQDVRTELRITRGQDFPTSMVGRLMVEMLSDQRFQAHLETEHGIRKPRLNGGHPIKYGEHRKS